MNTALNTALIRAGRTLAFALLCLVPPAAFAAPFTLLRYVAKTLTFAQKTVRLVAVTGPENDMLSYRISSLRNPTLVVPKGAVLTVLFVNTDDDMAHKSRSVLHGEEMTLHVPDTPGVYAYFCTVRGHAQGGMIGKILVRREAKKGTL